MTSNQALVPTGSTSAPIRTVTSTLAVKLSGKNYPAWKFTIKKTLVNRKLAKVVYLSHDGLSEEEKASKDAEASELLTNSLEPSIVNKVLTCETAREIWERLRLIYEQEGDANLESYIIVWSGIRQGEREDISDYIARYDEVIDKIQSLGEELSDRMKRAILIGGLNRRFDGFKRVWNQTSEKTYKKLIEMLFQDEAQQKHSEDQQSRRPVAMYVRRDGKEKKRLSKEDFAQLLSKSICRNCNETGHWAKYCKSRPKPRNEEQKAPEKKGDKKPLKIALMANLNGADKSHWYIDSGASNHMTFNKDLFAVYDTMESEMHITIGDDTKLRVAGIGAINFYCDLPNNAKRLITLQKVLLVPELKANLLSIGQASKAGANFTFQGEEASLKVGKTLVAKAYQDRSNNLFKLDMTPVPMRLLYSVVETPFDEWHRALAHVNIKQLQAMVSNKAVTGMKAVGKLPDKCNNCPAGKATHTSHPTSTRTRAEHVGDRVHLDLIGPIKPVSLGGSKYLMLLTDEASNYRTIYCLPSKTEVADKISEYLALVEVETGRRVQELWSDQGSEFLNDRVNTLLGIEHVKLETSTPYTPQQNGVAERSNRTVIEATRTMLNATSLPHELWGEAALTAVYILNRTTRKAEPKTTPFEKWYGRKPSVSHIHEFGTQVQVLETPRTKSKWASKTLDAYLTGFTMRSNTYRIFIPELQDVRVNCDVVFCKHGRPNNEKETGPPFEIVGESLCETVIEGPNHQDPSQDWTPCEDENLEYDDDTNQRQELATDTHRSNDQNDNLNMVSGLATPRNRFQSLREHFREGLKLGNRSTARPRDRLEDPREEDIASPAFSPLSASGDQTPPNNRDATFVVSKKIPPSPATEWKVTKGGISGLINFIAKSEPSNYQEAMMSKDKDKWQNAINDELESLRANNTWSIVPRTSDKNTLGSRWVLKKKLLPSGEIDRYKARLVARGYAQRQGIDFYETYAAVARYDTLRLFFALVAYLSLKMVQFDVKTAFLNGELEEEIYLDAPDGVDCPASCVLKLNKSIYGLKQAPLCWKKKFDKIVGEHNMLPTRGDPCLYLGNYQGIVIIMAVYVDDGLVAAKDEQILTNFIKEIGKQIDVNIISNNLFVGFEIVRSDCGSIFLHQKAHIESILRAYNMQDATPVTAPLRDVTELEEDGELAQAPYRELIGSLNYLSSVTRPDITYAVSLLSRYNTRPTQRHWAAAKMVLRYLKGTMDYGIKYHKQAPLRLECYSDSDWAGDRKERKSTSGMIIYLAGGPVVYRSKLQSTVALSSTEAEYIAASQTIQETFWISSLLRELRIATETPILHVDNQSAIKLIQTDTFQPRSKHIDVKYHHVKDSYKKNEFEIMYVTSAEQKADILTKALPPRQHSAKVSLLGLVTLLVASSSTECESMTPFGINDLVVWRPTKINHIQGEIDLSLHLMIYNPCQTYFANMTNIPKIDKALTSTCTKRFEKIITQPLQDLCSNPKSRREALSAVILTASAVSAVSAVIASAYVSSTSNQGQSELSTMKKLTLTIDEQLKHIQDLVIISNDGLSEKMDSLTRDIDLLAVTLGSQPELNDIYIDLMFKFNTASSKINKLKLRPGNPIPKQLVDFFNISELVTPTTLQQSQIHKCELQREGSIRIDATILKFSENVEILKADPFSYVSVEDGVACKYVYVGPTYVLHNKSADCIKPIFATEVIDEILLGDGCQVRQPMERNVSYEAQDCMKVTKEELSAPPAQIKHNGQLIHINCQSRFITLDAVKRECPNNVFTVDASKTFTIDDYTYTHEATSIRRPLADYSVPAKINLMIGAAHKTFRSLLAEEVESIREERTNENRKILANEMSKSLLTDAAGKAHRFVDRVGEYLAVATFLFLFVLFVKSRLNRSIAPTVVSALMLLTTVMADNHVIEIRPNRHHSNLEIKKHQEFLMENWCKEWRMVDNAFEFENGHGYYAHTLACSLASMEYKCECDSTPEYIPIVAHGNPHELPNYETLECPEEQITGKEQQFQIEQLGIFEEYLCKVSKDDDWSRSGYGKLVSSGCLLAKRMYNCACTKPENHKNLIYDGLTRRATTNLLKKIAVNGKRCETTPNRIKLNRTTVYHSFYSYRNRNDLNLKLNSSHA